VKSTRIIINVSFLRAAGTRAIIGIIFDDSISKKKIRSRSVFPTFCLEVFISTWLRIIIRAQYIYIYIYRNMSKRAVVT